MYENYFFSDYKYQTKKNYKDYTSYDIHSSIATRNNREQSLDLWGGGWGEKV